MIKIEFEEKSIKNVLETMARLFPLILASLVSAAILSVYFKENIEAIIEITAILYLTETFLLAVILEKSDCLAKFALREIANNRQMECLCMFSLGTLPAILALIIIG